MCETGPLWTGCISTDLEQEGVTAAAGAKVAVPDGTVVHVLLREGSRCCKAAVVC